MYIQAILRKIYICKISILEDDDVNDVIEYKNRFMLTNAIEWLNDLNNSQQLHLTASVIIANYARSGKIHQPIISQMTRL
jgi:hypothetical protein